MNRRGWRFYLVLILWSPFSLAAARSTFDVPPPLPNTMVALGDSMTEALLADFSNERGLPTSELFRMMNLATISDKEKRIVEFRKAYGAPQHSWATGESSTDLVNSHFERILSANPIARSWNLAVSGSRSYQLQPQLDQLFALMESEDFVVDYVMLLIGANDLMAESVEEFTTAMDYGKNIENLLRPILELNPQVSLLLMAPPDIFKIFEKTAGLTGASLFGKKISCEALRRNVYGDRVIFKPQEKENYDIAKKHLSEYWTELDALVMRLSLEFPLAHIQSVWLENSVQNPAKVISIDCFHPSEWGQAELAETSWRSGFWPELVDDLNF